MDTKNSFMGMSGFVWWMGVVENRKDPLNIGRCQIRIFGWHTDDLKLIPTEDLPWAQPLLPVNSYRDFTTPKEGQYVVGFFFDGDSAQFPAYFGVLPGIPSAAAIQNGIPSKGFTDQRSDTDLSSSPTVPKKVEAPLDGSGTTVANQPDKRYPAVAGLPTTAPLAINDPKNPPEQITQRTQNAVSEILGPKAASLSATISAAAQGASSSLTGAAPDLTKLIPNADSLKSSILVDGKPIAGMDMTKFNADFSAMTGSLPGATAAFQGQVSGLSDASSSLTGTLASAQSQASQQLASLPGGASGAMGSLTGALSGFQGQATDQLSALPGGINGATNSLVTSLSDFKGQASRQLASASSSLPGGVSGAASSLTSNLSGFQGQATQKLATMNADLANKKTELQASIDAAKAKAQEASGHSIDALSGQTGGISDKISGLLTGLVPTAIDTQHKVVVDNNVPKVVTPSTTPFADLLPNKIPDNVHIETVHSSLNKSKDNAVAAWKEMMLKTRDEYITRLNQLSNPATFWADVKQLDDFYDTNYNKSTDIGKTYKDDYLPSQLGSWEMQTGISFSIDNAKATRGRAVTGSPFK